MIYGFLILSVLLIDFSARLVLRGKSNQGGVRSAGIIALLALSLIRGPRTYANKSASIKRFLLSLLMVVFLGAASSLLLRMDSIENLDILRIGLILTPLFFMPFYHFLYDLMDIRPLMVRSVLSHFHLRGCLSLIISSNMIFVMMDPYSNVYALFGYFVFSLLALLGSLFLCAELRNRESIYQAPFITRNDAMDPAIFRYLASLLEILYYMILVVLIFVRGPSEYILADDDGFFSIALVLLAMLLVMTIMVWMWFYSGSVSKGFYSDKLLPLSFLFFGLTNAVKYYS